MCLLCDILFSSDIFLSIVNTLGFSFLQSTNGTFIEEQVKLLLSSVKAPPAEGGCGAAVDIRT